MRESRKRRKAERWCIKKNQSVNNVHWPLVLSCENHATTKVIHNTDAALSEPPLEKDPAQRAKPKHHIYAKGLHYMEPTALHSSKDKT